MFFIKELTRTMTLHPSFFNPMIREYLQNELLRSVEGNIQGDYYVICVLDSTMEISEGMVIPGTGRVEYTVTYRAVCFKPYRGEVVDGLVSSVIKSGFFVDVGPLLAFVSDSMIPEEIRFDETSSPPQFTDGQDQIIEQGTHVRIRIRGLRPDGANITAIATINEDFLGPIQNFDDDV